MTDTTGGRMGIVIHQIKLPDTSERNNLVLFKKFMLFTEREKLGKGFVTSTKIENTIIENNLENQLIATVEVEIRFHEKDGNIIPKIERGRIFFTKREYKSILGSKELYRLINHEVKKEIGRQIKDVIDKRRERKKKKAPEEKIDKFIELLPRTEEPLPPKARKDLLAKRWKRMRKRAQVRIRDVWRNITGRGRPGTRGK